MNTQYVRRAWIVTALIVFSSVTLLLLTFACGGGGGSVALQDTPSARSDSGYDSQYREATRSATSIEITERFTLEDIGGLLRYSKSALPDVEAWLLPVAYAADHSISETYLVRSGTLATTVESADTALQEIRRIAQFYKGAVTDSSISKDAHGQQAGNVTLRVPSEDFFGAWDELRSIGDVVSQSITSEDVGNDYVTSVSRMHSLLAEQVTLQKMLDEALEVQRRRGLGEGYSILLDTQQRLSNVSSEIREIENRITSLADQITRSTITVMLTEQPHNPVVKPERFDWGMGSVFNESLRDMLDILRGVAHVGIHFALTAWIWLVPLLLLSRLTWRWLKRYAKPTSPAQLAA